MTIEEGVALVKQRARDARETAAASLQTRPADEALSDTREELDVLTEERGKEEMVALYCNASQFFKAGVAAGLKFRILKDSACRRITLKLSSDIGDWLKTTKAVQSRTDDFVRAVNIHPPAGFAAFQQVVEIEVTFIIENIRHRLLGDFEITVFPDDDNSSDQVIEHLSFDFSNMVASEAGDNRVNLQLDELIGNIKDQNLTTAQIFREWNKAPAVWKKVELEPPEGDPHSRQVPTYLVNQKCTLSSTRNSGLLHLLPSSEVVTFGRKDDNDIVTRAHVKGGRTAIEVANLKIGRKHFHILLRDNDVWVIDGSVAGSRSRSGTYLNGRRVSRRKLRADAETLLGITQPLGNDQTVHYLLVLFEGSAKAGERTVNDAEGLVATEGTLVALHGLRQDHIKEDFLILWQPFNLKRAGLTGEDTWILPTLEGIPRNLHPQNKGKSLGDEWQIISNGELTYMDVQDPERRLLASEL